MGRAILFPVVICLCVSVLGCSDYVSIHADLRDAQTHEPVLEGGKFEFASGGGISGDGPDGTLIVGPREAATIRAKAAGYDLMQWSVKPQDISQPHWKPGSLTRKYPLYPEKRLEIKLTVRRYAPE